MPSSYRWNTCEIVGSKASHWSLGGKSDRGVVAACSYENKTLWGCIQPMPMKLALTAMPGCHRDFRRRWSLQHVLQNGNGYYPGESAAPCSRSLSIDEFYLDLTGMDRFFGCYQWSTELPQGDLERDAAAYLDGSFDQQAGIEGGDRRVQTKWANVEIERRQQSRIFLRRIVHSQDSNDRQRRLLISSTKWASPK